MQRSRCLSSRDDHWTGCPAGQETRRRLGSTGVGEEGPAGSGRGSAAGGA